MLILASDIMAFPVSLLLLEGFVILIVLLPIFFAPAIVTFFRNRSQLASKATRAAIWLNVGLLIAPLFFAIAFPPAANVWIFFPLVAIAWIYFVVWSVLPRHSLKHCFWITYFLSICICIFCLHSAGLDRIHDNYSLWVAAAVPSLPLLIYILVYEIAKQREATEASAKASVSDAGE